MTREELEFEAWFKTIEAQRWLDNLAHKDQLRIAFIAGHDHGYNAAIDFIATGE